MKQNEKVDVEGRSIEIVDVDLVNVDTNKNLAEEINEVHLMVRVDGDDKSHLLIFQADSPNGVVSLHDSYEVGRAGEELIDSFDDIDALNDALSPFAQAMFENTEFNQYMNAINSGEAVLIASDNSEVGAQTAIVYKIGDEFVACADHVECNQVFVNTMRVLDEDEAKLAESGVDLFELIGVESERAGMHM